MYCPKCGSANQDEVKFCTRCGTNLAVIAEALSGKTASQPSADERAVKLLKDYYSGRRAVLLGSVFLPIGALVLSLLMAAGMPEKLSIVALVALAAMVYGAICVVWGIGAWMESSSEMKAINHPALRETQGRALPGEKAYVTAPTGEYAADPMPFPGSVTESTTRQLEEGASNPAGERRLTSSE